MTIWLVRHPRPLIGPGICYGRRDLPLHPEGLAAIPGMVASLAPAAVTAIWTSPARRCRIVADAIAAAHNIAQQTDPRLLELDFGAWEGLRWDAVPRQELDRWAADPMHFAPGGGETGAALVARIRSFHADCLDAADGCVIVSHGGPLRVLGALLRGAPVNLLAAAPPLASVQIISDLPLKTDVLKC